MMHKLHVISYVTLLGSSLFQGEQLRCETRLCTLHVNELEKVIIIISWHKSQCQKKKTKPTLKLKRLSLG